MKINSLNLIPLFSWAQLYNLYFLLVVGRTFNSCLKDEKITGINIENNLDEQKKVQDILRDEIFNKALSYPEFSKISLIDNNGKQNIEDPITKKFYRNIDSWSAKSGIWRKSSNTSGSSGVSLKIIRSPKSFLNSQISFYLFLNQFKINRFDKNIYVGGARKNKVSLVSRFFNFCLSKITGTCKFVASDMISEEHYEEFLRTYELIKPKYLHGFSSALLRIADYVDEKNIILNWKAKLVHPNAEGISLNQRKKLEKVFGAPVGMVYGSAECHMASECPYGLMHVNMRSCDLKTKSDNSAILTVFESPYMPIVNYQMGDLIKLNDPPSRCKCGKHTTIVTDILGRINEKIQLPSGRVITHPDLNMLILQLDKDKLISEYQIIHFIGTDSIEIRHLSKRSFNPKQFSELLNKRFNDVNFYCSDEDFILLENGKKPVILSVNEVPLPRKTYEGYKPYFEISESQSKQHDPNVLKLDWNESTYDFPSKLKEKALKQLSSIPLNIYPDLQVSELKSAIGEWLNIKPECLTIFNGSDAGIATICRLFLEDTDSVVTIEPTYGNYKAIASRYTADVKPYKLTYPFEIDLEHFINFLKQDKQKLVFFTNPNNPTGVEYKRDTIFNLAEIFPRTCFVIDEAYVEFGENSLSVKNIPSNIIILRTFSKAFGLAGVRLGYCISNEELANKIAMSKDNKEVDVFAQIAGTLAVKNPKYMYDFVESISRGRKVITNFFDNQNIEYLAGKGNYVLFKVNNPNLVEESLKTKNIFIRNRNEVENLEGYLRVTLGDENMMKTFVSALEEIL